MRGGFYYFDRRQSQSHNRVCHRRLIYVCSVAWPFVFNPDRSNVVRDRPSYENPEVKRPSVTRVYKAQEITLPQRLAGNYSEVNNTTNDKKSVHRPRARFSYMQQDIGQIAFKGEIIST